MTIPAKLIAALPILALCAACVPAGGNDRVDTVGEVEATTDTTITGNTVPGNTGVPTRP